MADRVARCQADSGSFGSSSRGRARGALGARVFRGSVEGDEEVGGG